jgi:hypothetical protein
VRERVVLSAVGVQFQRDDGRTSSFLWADVAHVFLYRVDFGRKRAMAFVTFDLRDGRYWEVHDEMDGFDVFVDGLAAHLPLSHLDWRSVLQAATEEDRPVTIYGQP